MNYYYSRWDESRCGSRVRCLLPFRHLNITNKLPLSYQKGDIIFFRTPNNKELQKAKQQGAIAIYDVCDLWFALMNRKTMELMMNKCDLITTSTQGLKIAIEKKFNKQIIVVPSALDWDYKSKKVKGIKRRNKVAVWTSYGHAFFNLEMIYHNLIDKGIKIKVISSIDFLDRFKYKKNIEFIEWDLETVDFEIAKADFMVVPLRDRQANRIKEEHRMLKAWAIGLPCYVTPMNSYIDFCNRENIDKNCLVKDWSKLKKIKWEPRLREIALKYSAKNIAKRFEKIIKELRNKMF